MRPTDQELSIIAYGVDGSAVLPRDALRAVWDAATKAERERCLDDWLGALRVAHRGVPATDEMIEIYESGPGKGNARHGLGLRVLWNAATVAERERCLAAFTARIDARNEKP